MTDGNFKFTPGGMNQQPPVPPGGAPGMGAPGAGQQFQLNVDPKELASVECPECGGKIYHQKMVLKKMSALQSPTGKEGILPVNIIVCAKCSHPVKDFSVCATYLPSLSRLVNL